MCVYICIMQYVIYIYIFYGDTSWQLVRRNADGGRHQNIYTEEASAPIIEQGYAEDWKQALFMLHTMTYAAHM